MTTRAWDESPLTWARLGGLEGVDVPKWEASAAVAAEAST